MLIFYLFVMGLLTLLCLAYIIFVIFQIMASFSTDAPFVPVPNGVEDYILESLHLDSNSVFYDLGCGDGRILIRAVKEHPEIKTVGVEVAFFPYLLAKFYTRNHHNIKIKRENIFATNLSDATHVYLYLYPEVMNKLLPIFRKKCKPGTRIVSCDFEFANYRPLEIIPIQDVGQKRGKKLFVYTI